MHFVQFVRTLAAGGPVMVPLLACSFLAVFVIIERYFYLRAASRFSQRLITELEADLAEGDTAAAVQRCECAGGTVTAVLAAGLRAAMHRRDPEKAMMEQAMAEVPSLNRGLPALDTIVTVAPLLGLLGTVTGMIRSFGIVAKSGASQPAGITAGVAEALIATATGLVIAIMSLVAYNYFVDRVRRITSEAELRSTQIEHFLQNLAAKPTGEYAMSSADRC
jgi:biopolymer transport protein ExbB